MEEEILNNQLEEFARTKLKEGLAQCTDDQQHLFKQMYAFENLDCPINEAVDNMSAEKLDWAMQQVERTLKNKETLNGSKNDLP